MITTKERPGILCMFSGGIDSTGVLHQLLTNKEFEEHPIILHHIHIHNRENRAKAESLAVKEIIAYYKSNVRKEFLVTESNFSTMGFAALRSNRFPFDMDICAFLAGNICAARKDIGFVAMGRTKTDVDTGGDNFAMRMKRAQAIFQSVLSLEERMLPKYIFPVVDFTKKEIWDFLPEDVRDNTWWCRRPLYKENQRPKPCGKCITCEDVKDFVNARV